MAVMEALLKIKADVTGEGEVLSLNRALGGVGTTAAKVTGTLRGMASGAGNLAGAMGTLTPLLSAGGLIGMAKSALDAGDAMNDLSQRTGISVESLAKFKKAASVSGTDIESVAKASQKLSKGLYEAATTGKGPAAEALQTLGVKATDAAGKVRNADAVMLDIANKFKAMPNGATKTALAMQLFGRAGAEMIPMLNMGGDAIDKLKTKMTTAFAQKADEYKDKLTVLSGKVGALGMDLTIALLPALEMITNAVIAGVDAFSKMPEPLRAIVGGLALLSIAFVALSPLITGVISLVGMLSGLQLGATIAGWLGAIGPAIAAMTGLLGGFLTWIGTTLIPGLIGFFSGPVGWTVLAVAAVVAMCIAFREPIGQFFQWLGQSIAGAMQTIWQWGEPIRGFFAQLWTGIGTLFTQYVVNPLSQGWTALGQLIPNTMQRAADFVSGVWKGVVNTIRSVINGVMSAIAGSINTVIRLVNNVIAGFNKLPGPDLPFIPMVQVPAFAEGGYVNQPTMAMVGEGGEPEYIVPQSKAAGFAANYLAGVRGAAAVQQAGGAGPTSAQVNIQTGPVTRLNGTDFVTKSDMSRAVAAGVEQTLALLRNDINTRRAVGIA